MATEPITTTLSSSNTGAEEASKHIINAINSIAKIKAEQIKFKKELMLDELKRKRNLNDRRAEKEMDYEFEQRKQRDIFDTLKEQYPTEQGPEQTQPMEPQETTVPGPQGGMIRGQEEGAYPEAQKVIPMVKGVQLRKPIPRIKYTTRGLAVNPAYDSAQEMTYRGVYEKLANGGSLSEGEEKIALKGNYGLDLTDKKSDKVEKVLGVINRGGIFDKGGKIVLDNEEDATDYVESELGYGWEEKYPQVKKMIEEKYPTEKDNYGFSVGEVREVPGKGNFEYIGNNEWKRK